MDIIREKRNTALVGSGSIFQKHELDGDDEPVGYFQAARSQLYDLRCLCQWQFACHWMGYFLIHSGMQDCIVCGEQEVNMYSVGSFDGLAAFSVREDDQPEQASRPFDKDRDGLVPRGEVQPL